MLKLKDIKERFNCNACVNLDKHYNIYSKTMMVCEKIDDVDFSRYDEMLLRQVKGFAMEETSFKDHLIKTLEDTLNKLKCN